MKNIVVTGGAGFIGSQFVRYMVETYPQYNIITLDKLTYAGNTDNLLPVHDQPNHHFERADIADRVQVKTIIEKYQVDTVVNFAAESHVDRSILDPDAFIHTDVVGTYILLDVCKTLGVERFHHVSTDEVYGTKPTGFFTEADPLQPNNPYSASKAGAELMVRAYQENFGLFTTITRGSNTYGPYQYPEKLIPFFVTEALDNRPLPVYGNGMQVRDWLHVYDHATGVDFVLHHGEPGGVYNVGGENERHNIDVTHMILRALGKPETLIRHVEDRLGHDKRYALTAEKLRNMGWKRKYNATDFEQGLADTVKWYQENEWWWRKIKTGEYLEFYKKQYGARLGMA
jgi:dTDP-glucose 4,6-dehydratase